MYDMLARPKLTVLPGKLICPKNIMDMIDMGVHTNANSNIIVVTAKKDPSAYISYRCVVKDTIDVCLKWTPEIVNILERSVHFIHSKVDVN